MNLDDYNWERLAALGYPADFALSHFVPGTAIGVVIGDLAFTWMALRLARVGADWALQHRQPDRLDWKPMGRQPSHPQGQPMGRTVLLAERQQEHRLGS